jgi:pimeloyl-ACP methyl ester carboxylesterase
MTRLPTLLLLPGLTCDAEVWAPQVQALGDVAHCVVPDWGSPDTLAAMAERLLAQAPSERFAVAGHSMGGRVALEVWRLAPQRVRRLALLSTGFHPLPAGEAGERERAGRQALIDLAQTQGMRAMGQQWARGMVHPRRLDSPVFEAILAMQERCPIERYVAQQAALLARPDAGPLLPSISVPTLVLTGQDDGWSGPAQHQAMAAAIPGARLCLVPDSGHMVTWEQPEAVSAALRQWLLA